MRRALPCVSWSARGFPVWTVIAVGMLGAGCRADPPRSGPVEPFNVVEAPIADLRRAMEEGRTTSRHLVEHYLMRIALYEDRINATLAVNPNALQEADARDRERAEGKVRGPLHGIPIALKDNVHTTDMPTTGGAVAFEGLMPPYDATLSRKPARRGRDHPGQDEHDRAGQLGRGRDPRRCPATTTGWAATV